jgi:hypothetical protein
MQKMVTNRTAIDGELDHDGIKTAAAGDAT